MKSITIVPYLCLSTMPFWHTVCNPCVSICLTFAFFPDPLAYGSGGRVRLTRGRGERGAMNTTLDKSVLKLAAAQGPVQLIILATFNPADYLHLAVVPVVPEWKSIWATEEERDEDMREFDEGRYSCRPTDYNDEWADGPITEACMDMCID